MKRDNSFEATAPIYGLSVRVDKHKKQRKHVGTKYSSGVGRKWLGEWNGGNFPLTELDSTESTPEPS